MYGIILVAVLSFSTSSLTIAQEDSDEAGTTETPIRKSKRQIKSNRKKPAASKNTRKSVGASTLRGPNRYDIGLGIGMFNFYPPQPTLQLAYRFDSMLSAGIEFGYFAYKGSEISSSGSYYGIDGKYHPFRGAFFAGLGVGQRTLDVVTNDDFTVSGEVINVEWSRHVSQMTASPRIGWMSIGNSGSTILFSLGALVPFATQFSITHDPDPIPNLPSDEEDAEEDKKANDVKKITNSPLPQIELKYIWFFDWVK